MYDGKVHETKVGFFFFWLVFIVVPFLIFVALWRCGVDVQVSDSSNATFESGLSHKSHKS